MSNNIPDDRPLINEADYFHLSLAVGTFKRIKVDKGGRSGDMGGRS
ncbi:MAG: hypothetical protein GQ559_11675 [Desulfobulbaceae bacterium]|nr:hypothetical protein [Desulfobulbaceae bacterium]